MRRQEILAALVGSVIFFQSADAHSAQPQPLRGRIERYECGDNCYLTIVDKSGVRHTGLCAARECEPWNKNAAMPRSMVGQWVIVTIEIGDQVDGEGATVAQMSAFTSIKPVAPPRREPAARRYTDAPAAADAKDVKGTPAPLIGHFGTSPAQCQSYHRRSDEITKIGPQFMTSCGGSGCEAKIVSHRKTRDGYALWLVSRGSPAGWWQKVRTVEDRVVEFHYEIDGQKSVETLVRCSPDDLVLGIGRKGDGAGMPAFDLAFSAYYALAIPSTCPNLEVDRDKAEKVAALAQEVWAKQATARGDKPFGGLSVTERAHEAILHEKETATSAVLSDAAEIKGFCSKVLDAYGTDGQVLRNLVKDPRRKA